MIVVVPQAAIEPRFNNDGIGVPRRPAVAVFLREPPIESVRIVVLEKFGNEILGEGKLSGLGGRPGGLEVIFRVAGIVFVEIGRLDYLHGLRRELILERGECGPKLGEAVVPEGIVAEADDVVIDVDDVIVVVGCLAAVLGAFGVDDDLAVGAHFSHGFRAAVQQLAETCPTCAVAALALRRIDLVVVVAPQHAVADFVAHLHEVGFCAIGLELGETVLCERIN